MIPLDNYTLLTPEMQKYLYQYGFHFSKKACDYAIKLMRKLDEASGKKKPIEPKTKEEVDKILAQYGMTPENDRGYDAVYLFHMAKADYPKLCPDEQRQAMFVKETLDDPDTSEETTFRVWLAKMAGNGYSALWEDIM